MDVARNWRNRRSIRPIVRYGPENSCRAQGSETAKEVVTIDVAVEDGAPLNAPNDDMVQGIGSIEPWAAWHGADFTVRQCICKLYTTSQRL